MREQADFSHIKAILVSPALLYRCAHYRCRESWLLLLAALAALQLSVPPLQAQWGGLFPLADEPPPANLGEPFGAEDTRVGHKAPRVPEPMVFDLMRPLDAQRGEWELSTLALFRTRPTNAVDPPDALGLEEISSAEWAPEVEFTIADGLAFEFELPYDDSQLAAYRAGAQCTFGTAFADTYIHGAQMLVESLTEASVTELTFLYLAGVRFDEYWSALAMIGFRANTGDIVPKNRVETLVNFTLFRDVSDYMTLGVESNYAANQEGKVSLLIMPQLAYEISHHMMIQAGMGVRFVDTQSIPTVGLRGIYTF